MKPLYRTVYSACSECAVLCVAVCQAHVSREWSELIESMQKLLDHLGRGSGDSLTVRFWPKAAIAKVSR